MTNETDAASAPSIDDLLGRLFDRMSDADAEHEIHAALIANADQIREIALACKSTNLFGRFAKQFDEFKVEFESQVEPADRLIGSWAWLSDRIANSPTKAHMLASVRLCLPLVALYLPVH